MDSRKENHTTVNILVDRDNVFDAIHLEGIRHPVIALLADGSYSRYELISLLDAVKVMGPLDPVSKKRIINVAYDKAWKNTLDLNYTIPEKGESMLDAFDRYAIDDYHALDQEGRSIKVLLTELKSLIKPKPSAWLTSLSFFSCGLIKCGDPDFEETPRMTV